MRFRQVLLMVSVTALLAACGGSDANSGGVPQGRLGDESINWPNDPSHIVFQIDVVGGLDTIEQRNDVPLCTIYGDGRVVWVPNSQPGQNAIFFDALQAITIRDFVLDLVVNFQVYNYSSLADVQALDGSEPVYEQIIVNVNDERHVTDGFDNWPTDFFREILDKCQNLSQAPALVEPTGGWMSAAYTDFDEQATIINWNAEASGIDLIQLIESDEMLWVDNEVLPVLWNVMTNSPRNRIFAQRDSYFLVALQVPNVHRDTPPTPTNEELAEARSLIPLDIEIEEEN